MNETIRLGRLAGVRIGLHWSVVGIVVLVTVALAAYQLPRGFPGHTSVGYWCAGVVASTLLVGSLLGHEIAHAVVARRNGLAVEGIVLWLLGGVARLGGEARNPGAEFRIAVVGPVASAGLGMVFGTAAWLAGRVGANDLVAAVLGYMSLLNLVLAVFNLAPAAPLDGGRLLRAVLWAWKGDRFKAAVWSAWAGRGLGFLLIAAGLVQLMLQGPEGLWWMLLGWFVVTVAAAEHQQARVGLALAGVRVRDVMSTPVETVDGRLTVEQALRDGTLDREHAALPLLDETGRFDGLVMLRRLRNAARHERATTTLRKLACSAERVPMAEPDELLAVVLSRLTNSAEGHVVVTRGDELAGIISPSNISRVVAEHGLHISLPGNANPRRDRDVKKSPPPGWWYPGQQGR